MKDLNLYLPYNGDDRFYKAVAAQARIIKSRNKHDIPIESIIEAIIKEEFEKASLALELEELIDFNDEIVEIEYLGEQEMLDITVSRDNLFCANGIVTRNSMGVPQTADYMVSLTRTDELDEMNQVMCKQIKSRYGDKSELLRFVLGVNQARQQYYDVENPALSKLKATESRRVEADASSTPKGGTAARFANLL